VDFREPVKVIPAFAQATVFPFKSVIVIIVLLKVACICAIPSGMFLRSLLLPRKAILLFISFQLSVVSFWLRDSRVHRRGWKPRLPTTDN
jgi:hypothetical protein